MIYLDHAAATPVNPKVKAAMESFLSDNFFNPSAPYFAAKKVRDIYEKAKDDLAHVIGAKGSDLVITSGATESNNLALRGVVESVSASVLNPAASTDRAASTHAIASPRRVPSAPRIAALACEHDSVLRAAPKTCPVDFIRVDETGLADLTDLKAKITRDTCLVSISLANNEIGTIQPIAEISEILKTIRADRRQEGNDLPLYLHVDAAQALNLIDISVSRLGVDLMTISSAKVYGPKGVGALYISHDVKLAAQITGGGQENGLRSGTENVAGLIGFSKAAEIAHEHLVSARQTYENYSKIFHQELDAADVKPKFLGHKKRLANFCSVSFDGLDAERLIYLLEQKEIYVSTGAACAASKGKKSNTLTAISLTDSEIKGSLRISFGATNDEAGVRLAAREIVAAVNSEKARLEKTHHEKIELQKSEIAKFKSPKTVYVGMSGGVDSSVSAVLLKEQGYHVVGVYMKNWSRDLPGMKCPWADDLADAKRVAVKFGLDFEVFDFETEYKQKVVDYMIDEFKKGHTPNPDIMCNQEVKFKLFYDVAREKGADLIATGHYARVAPADSFSKKPAQTPPETSLQNPNETANKIPQNLLRAVDENKDQTYFLYRISDDALRHTLFPIGEMEKPEVKKFAETRGLQNAYKKESMGVCFVGEVGMKDFLKTYLAETGELGEYQKPGDIIDIDTNQKIGTHDGAIFVTIGQRHGLDVGSDLPYYVVGKNMQKNEVYVSKNLNSSELWTDTLKLRDIILRGSVENAAACAVRLRHRAPLVHATLIGDTLHFKEKIKRPAPGQSAVFYDGEICLGGGIIEYEV